MKQKITFIRHGMTEGNFKKEYTGRADVPLCKMGVAGIIAKREEYPPCDMLFTSSLQRTQQTARLIYGDMPYTVIDDIRECDMGDFEGKTYEELKDNKDYQRFLDPFDGYIPNGECLSDFKERCKRGFYEISRLLCENGHKNCSVVCHGGVIMAIMGLFFNDEAFYGYRVKNGGGYTLLFDTDSNTSELLNTID